MNIIVVYFKSKGRPITELGILSHLYVRAYMQCQQCCNVQAEEDARNTTWLS
jgi:hypothetical protein